MSGTLVLTVLLALAAAGFVIARQRAKAMEAAAERLTMHSRPRYHGWRVFLLTLMPALVFLLLWVPGTAIFIEQSIKSQLPIAKQEAASATLDMSMIRGLANGLRVLEADGVDNPPRDYAGLRAAVAERGVPLAGDGADYMVPLSQKLNAWYDRAQWVGGSVAIAMALAGLGYGLSRIRLRVRARNNVETAVLLALWGASALAVLTTAGIVLSVLFQTITFFQSVSPMNFLFGTVWDPRFADAGSGATAGQFGLIPLLAGTLYIAFVAMLFAVPVGLFSAIYMAEYASNRARSVIKPLLEVLAGIPTIVYGIFALVTVGPFLRDISAAIAGGGGFIQAQSVLTAGLVMGVMLIPFVSSLTDDVITAVPRTLRDGSYGLGATQSETIRKVVLPAALPGIVGALLLTASRAIGETMIVVLAAGVAARLSLNPFEPMTTITVKIVNQLTGDLEFNSPQTLVAFALGLTLFVLTLMMNIYALFVVRKYREQYE